MRSRVFNYRIKASELIENSNIEDYRNKTVQVLKADGTVRKKYKLFYGVVKAPSHNDVVILCSNPANPTGTLRGYLHEDCYLAFDNVNPSSHSPHTPSHSPPHSPHTPSHSPPHSPHTPSHSPPHSPHTPSHSPPHSPHTPSHSPPHSPHTPPYSPPRSSTPRRRGRSGRKTKRRSRRS